MTMVERFAGEHFTLEGISPDRQRLVRKMLAELERHAGMPVEAVDAPEFRRWMAAQLERGLHVNTVRRNANCVRPFFKWAWRERIIDGERYLRLADVSNPRGSTNRALPRPYKREQIAAFWRELDERWPLDATGKWARRFDRGLSRYPRIWPHAIHLQIAAITHLALHGGLRRREIFALGIDDMHPDNAYIVVQGAAKGHNGGAEPKVREVPYTVSAREAVGQWLRLRSLIVSHFGAEHARPWLGLHPTASPNNPLLPSTPAAPASFDRFESLLRTVGAWELHRLRHTCGTEWLRAGMELENVSRLLGHASIAETMGYAEIVKDDVQRSMHRSEANFERALGKRETERDS